MRLMSNRAVIGLRMGARRASSMAKEIHEVGGWVAPTSIVGLAGGAAVGMGVGAASNRDNRLLGGLSGGLAGGLIGAAASTARINSKALRMVGRDFRAGAAPAWNLR